MKQARNRNSLRERAAPVMICVFALPPRRFDGAGGHVSSGTDWGKMKGRWVVRHIHQWPATDRTSTTRRWYQQGSTKAKREVSGDEVGIVHLKNHRKVQT